MGVGYIIKGDIFRKLILISVGALIVFLFTVSVVCADDSLLIKESKNKFDPLLISYLQNESEGPSTPIQRGPAIKSLDLDKIPVIITLYDRSSMTKVRTTLTQGGARIKFSFELINAIAADVPPSMFESLAKNKDIKQMYLDRKIQVSPQDIAFEKKIYDLSRKANSKEMDYNNQIVPKLYESTKLIDAPFMWDLGINGSGVKIAILDTGIDDTHPDLVGKVIAKRDFTLFDNELKTTDGFGHGTHVAGIASGTGADSVRQIDTSSTDTSGLSNLPFIPNTYHLSKEVFKFGWDDGIKEYNILIVDSPPSQGNATLFTAYNDNYFDFEISSKAYRYADLGLFVYPLAFYTPYGGIKDMGGNLIDTVTCTSDGYTNALETYLNHTYCVLTDKGNYVKIYVTNIQPDHVDFLYKFQSTRPPLVFLDLDGDFNTKSDQLVAINNTHFVKVEKTCYSETDCWYEYTADMVFDLSSDLRSVKAGFDLNWDEQPDSLKGVAPGAKLLNGKVLSDEGYGYDSGIIAGIEWAVLQGADVISMSLGGGENICDGNDPKSEAVEKASDMGITVVVAAGNAGYWGAETLGSPGCADKIITVGASSKYSSNLYIAPFSSQGPTVDGRIKPEVLAPGEDIVAPQASDTEMSYSPIPGYVSASGTSMATPHVAGAVALLKQMNPSLKPKEIKNILMNSAMDIEGESVFREGAGVINMSKAYYEVSNSKNFASPSILNLILGDTDNIKLKLNTTLANPQLSAFKDELERTQSNTFEGGVNQTDGFVYNFSINEKTVLFKLSINWSDASNDIDMRLRDPSGQYYAWSVMGGTNFESIQINNPEQGVWSLEVYPFLVTETVNVDGYLYLENLIPWDWFSYDNTKKELTISPNEEESGLYAGKIMLTSSDNRESTMIPTSIILSKQIGFSGMVKHNYISEPCKGGGIVGEWSSPGSSTESYASFDESFCKGLERRAYSFTIPNNAPYFDVFINWWTPSVASYEDIRMLIYDPDGNLYGSIDTDGNFESGFVYQPMPGNWTVVVESEGYVSEDGIIFSGEVTIPSIIFNPESMWLTLKQGEETTNVINVTNLVDYDLDFSVEKTIWQETPLTVTPSSETDNSSLGPFIYSYRYYNFYIPSEYINNIGYIKSKITLGGDSTVYGVGVYIFDADGIFVNYDYNYYSNELVSYHYIPSSATPGNWTIVVFVDGFYSDQYPFAINLWTLNNTQWDWAQVTGPPHFFQGTESMTLGINVSRDTPVGDKIAALYLNGGWWEGKLADRTFNRPLSTIYPVMLTIVNGTQCSPSVEICDGIDNDCDGLVDENLGNVTCGLGICQNTVETCINGTLQFCNPYQGTTQEICGDGIDQDCNGQDEQCNYKIYSPLTNNNYSDDKVPINITLTRQVPYLRYTDYSDSKPSTKTLCTKCMEWGYNKSKTITLDDGYHNITVFSSDGFINQITPLFVDSTAPKISDQEPDNKGYCNGYFKVKYTEYYPTNFKLHYGTDLIEKQDCPPGRNQECEFNVSLGKYENKSITFYFEVQDTFNTVPYKRSHTCLVDTIPPNFTNLVWNSQSNYLNLNISLDEKARYLKYIDYGLSSPRENSLCSNCNQYGATSTQKKSFSRGNHNVVIIAEDAAGNRKYSQNIIFTV